jgi:eukaryotic-like serine/threonine-protein kinase
LPYYGWFQQNSSQILHPTGSLKPNDLGLFDVLGNVYEWCGDAYYTSYATADGGILVDTLAEGEYSNEPLRVLRGGTFSFTAAYARSADRDWFRPAYLGTNFGFRVARTIP